MDSHTAQVQELFLNPLRVLAEYDTTYKTHVAYCLETGSVVTAETADDLKTMMKELLEDEISFAIANKNLTNLFSTPASFDVFLKWQEAAKNGVEDITLDIENPIRPKGPEGAKRQSSFIARVTHVDVPLEQKAQKVAVIMKADKGQFDEVLRRMLEKPPQKTSEIHKPKREPKAQGQDQK